MWNETRLILSLGLGFMIGFALDYKIRVYLGLGSRDLSPVSDLANAQDTAGYDLILQHSVGIWKTRSCVCE